MQIPKKECDYLVLGLGSGGVASARRASGRYGTKTIAIERKKLGGTCVNVGCVPRKVTWNAASMASNLADAKAYGFSWSETSPFDWPTFKRKRDDYVANLNKIYEKNLEKDSVEVLFGSASSLNKNEVEVVLNEEEQKQIIYAKHILITTGGHPNFPTNTPRNELGISSDGFFELEKQPKVAALVGAGYIAIETAGTFHALGTETHLFVRSGILKPFDSMVREAVETEYKRMGIVIHYQSEQTKIEDLGKGWKRIHFEDSDGEGTLDVDCLMWAIGRAPEIDDLNLKEVGVELNEKGNIKVDDYQNTSVDGIYSLGDVCGKVQLTPVAIAAGRKLSDRLFGTGKDAHLDYNLIPSSVFAHPEVGTIGMTEDEAQEKYGKETVKCYHSEFTSMYYAVMDQNDKVKTRYKLVSEIIKGFGLAIKMGATKKDFESLVPVHPTMAEEILTMS